MEYPYIGGLGNDCVTLFTDSGEGVAIKHPTIQIRGNVERYWIESDFKNITREYLEGKCVKIESPEHSEFVQKLAFNAGFKWHDSGVVVKHKNESFISFWDDGDMTHGKTQDFDFEQITIPLPPKAEPEHKEWPQVGDEVAFKTNPGNDATIIATVKYIGDKFTILKSKSGREFSRRNSKLILLKPKTEAEILRDELIDLIENTADVGASTKELVETMFNKYNITKKPQ